MSLADVLLLAVAGLAAGMVNALAGGGSVITFPALMATGMGALPANVTNSVAVFPGYVSSVAGSRTDLVALMTGGERRAMLRLIPAALLGSGAGCLLLLSTPAEAFEAVVPFLVLAAVTVLACQSRLRRLIRQRGVSGNLRRALTLHTMVLLCAVYGGYFGAALGVLLLAGLGLVLDQTLARLGALKNALSVVTGLVTVLSFGLLGPVAWDAVLCITPATIVGGYAGARAARLLPGDVLRGVVVGFGLVVGLVLLVQSRG